jgi:Ion channel
VTRATRPARFRFWTDDRDLSIFLAMIVAIILVPTLLPVGLLGRLIGDALTSVMLISGAAAVADKPRTVLIVSVITGATLLVRWASWLFPTPTLAVWGEIFTLATLGILSYVILRLVLRRGPITTNRIQGAIAVYLLLGLTWAHAYGLVTLWHPGAFTGAVDDPGPLRWTYYYSFVTLTTMGYGDIMPVHPLARALAVLEALTGQLYLAIMLARLVSLELQSRRDG